MALKAPSYGRVNQLKDIFVLLFFILKHVELILLTLPSSSQKENTQKFFVSPIATSNYLVYLGKTNKSPTLIKFLEPTMYCKVLFDWIVLIAPQIFSWSIWHMNSIEVLRILQYLQ